MNLYGKCVNILTGTLVNTAAIAAGGTAGLIIKKSLSHDMQDILIKVLGVATMFIGLSGALSKLLIIDNNQIQSANSMLMVCSLVIGTVIGQLINLDHMLIICGNKAKSLLKLGSDNHFTESFVTVTIVVCVGAMSVIGSFEDGMHGDPTILFTKSIIDGVIVMIFASTLGIGAIFSAIPLFFYEAALSIMGAFIAPYLNADILDGLSAVGSVLIFIVGLNLIFGEHLNIRVANTLPALFVPAAYYLLILL